METPKIKSTNTPPLNEVQVEDFTVRFVAMKAFFVNEIFRLKMEIKSLKEKLQNGEISLQIQMMIILKILNCKLLFN